MEPVTINATKLRIETRDLLERVKFNGERFIIETFGRPMAVVISFDDFLRVKEALTGSQASQPSISYQATTPPMTRRRNKSRVKTAS